MAYNFVVDDDFVPVGPEDLVSFIVLCRPQSGMDLATLRESARLDRLREFVPDSNLVIRVKAQLSRMGFEVFEDPSPVVSARGTVELFRSIFSAPLVKRIRKVTTSISKYSVESIVARSEADVLASSASPIDGALSISLASPPLFNVPAIPPATGQFCLKVPGEPHVRVYRRKLRAR